MHTYFSHIFELSRSQFVEITRAEGRSPPPPSLGTPLADHQRRVTNESQTTASKSQTTTDVSQMTTDGSQASHR